MKLLRFKVNTPEGFRSLQQGFEIHFLNNYNYNIAHEFNPNILTGRNGSGKSNVLEAMANIFYHLDCMYADYLPDNFSKKSTKKDDEKEGTTIDKNYVFDNTICVVDAFELEYLIDIPATVAYRTLWNVSDFPNYLMQTHIKISKEIGKQPVIKWINIPTDNDREIIFDKTLYQQLLPKYVIGYSSGENELLSLPFFKTRFLHYDEYSGKLTRGEPFGYPPKSEGKLVYLDNQYSQAILLANLLMQDEKVLAPFNDEVELEDLDEFRLIIRLDNRLHLHDDIIRDRKITLENLHNDYYNTVPLTHNLRDSIEILKKCATCFETKFIEQENNEVGREYLILDYKVTLATKEAFRFHFANEQYNKPLQLFQFFQILLELNAYVVSEEDKMRVYKSNNIFINHDIYPNPLEDDRIIRFKNLYIKKKGIKKPLFTKELSDGEHQFLHSLGLCLLFKNENCLFLLDEPETHFNPDWKAKFISSIRHCFALEESSTMREMLITTHSPYLVSDSDSKHVNVFVKDNETKRVTCRFPEFQTLGASVNKITIEVFKTPLTIGRHAYTFLKSINDRFEKGENKDTLLAEIEDTLGDSVEKTMLIHKLRK
jgi:restriction system-associated AAA family ATPase